MRYRFAMKEFFEVSDLQDVFEYIREFPEVESEDVALADAPGRVLAEDVVAGEDLPEFSRSVMDGYAVRAASTFGASEASPAFLTVMGSVAMGETPAFSVGMGEAARISTGGMLPEGAECVIMVEHTERLDDTTIEAYKSIAPGQNIIARGEDFAKGQTILSRGQQLKPPETGLLAAFGRTTARVFKQPVVGILSTGDEIVPVDRKPPPGTVRDINTYTLLALVKEAGGIPVAYGIVRDHYADLFASCRRAVEECDMTLISGGSSVGVRDFTIDVLSALPESEILVHGISISPGKPTILAKAGHGAVWGLPGHVASAMVVFQIVVRPFIHRVAGRSRTNAFGQTRPAVLTRNINSAQGRVDYVRVRLFEEAGVRKAEPILGKSALINTMVRADGLVAVGLNTEGLDKDAAVEVIPL
ncbi:MAG: molybdopterin molybdotransferase MoeA [Pirellulaceae bacterium]